MEKQWYNPQQIEEVFGIRAGTVRAWYRQGRVSGMRIGRSVLIDAGDLHAKLAKVKAGQDWSAVFKRKLKNV